MINQLTLLGRLTRDIELKTTAGGTTLAKGGIAVDSYAGKDRDGQAKKRTLFLDFVAFETTAENLAKHFKKGEPIILVGELVYQTWETDGQKRSKHEMSVQRWSFVPGSGNAEKAEGAEQAPPPRRGARGNDGEVPF